MPLSDASIPASAASGDLAYHGGNLAAAEILFPDGPRPWLDLSTGINPVAYPIGEIALDAWARLPSPAALAALEAAAARRYGAGDGVELVAAPGTQALIQLLPRLFTARRIGILGFTYGEYERVWRESGTMVGFVDQLADLVDFDVAIVVNPNNPDGSFFPPARLRHLAETMARRGGLLVVDEAFIDLAEEGSLVPSLRAAGAVVLRSFGKTYGLAGLRLGFVATTAELAASFRQALGPWAVSGPAIQIGTRALGDDFWLHEARQTAQSASAALAGLLVTAGFELVGTNPLFVLVAHRDARQWFDTLGRKGILVRHFPARPHWLRFGLPANQAEQDRLGNTLGLGPVGKISEVL